MKHKALIAPLLGLLLAGCPPLYTDYARIASTKPITQDDKDNRYKLLVGHWFGRQRTLDKKVREWKITRDIDGAYEVRFRVLKPRGDCNEIEDDQREFGRWGVSGSIYFSTLLGFRDIDGNVLPDQPSYPYGHNAYRILNLTQDQFSYEHVETGNRFTVNRVSGNSDLSEFGGNMICDG